MRRILGPCLAVLLILAGLGATVRAAPAEATVQLTPRAGVYGGSTTRFTNADISFTYSVGVGQVMHFKAQGRTGGVLEHAAVSGHTAQGCTYEVRTRICVRLEWTSDTEVTGFWGHGKDVKNPFVATLKPPPDPQRGLYVGTDARGDTVSFVYAGRPETAQAFGLPRHPHLSIDGSLPVSGAAHHFEGCSRTICVQGHWQTNTLAVGTWRLNDDNPEPGWRLWEARLDGSP